MNLVDNDNDVVAQAQIIEYNQDSEVAVMQIKINLTQKDNVCTSAYAIYRKNEQILEMSGNPKIVQNGDTFRAQVIKLDMDSQEITLSGKVKGSVVTTNNSDEDEESEENTDGTTAENSTGENTSENPEATQEKTEDGTSENQEENKTSEGEKKE